MGLDLSLKWHNK